MRTGCCVRLQSTSARDPARVPVVSMFTDGNFSIATCWPGSHGSPSYKPTYTGHPPHLMCADIHFSQAPGARPHEVGSHFCFSVPLGTGRCCKRDCSGIRRCSPSSPSSSSRASSSASPSPSPPSPPSRPAAHPGLLRRTQASSHDVGYGQLSSQVYGRGPGAAQLRSEG